MKLISLNINLLLLLLFSLGSLYSGNTTAENKIKGIFKKKYFDMKRER